MHREPVEAGILHRYFLNNGGKRLHKWVHYFDIYERHFARFRDTEPTVLEIGVAGGGSLAMWKDYFGQGSRIVGLDVDPSCRQHAAQGVDVVTGSQDDPAVIDLLVDRYGPFDVVIDDGSHIAAHVCQTFRLLYHRMSPTGVYLVEDLHTQYWKPYGGGLRREGTFIELSKALVDELNAFHFRKLPETSAFTRSTDSMTFYDSIVVFERRPQAHRQAPITAAMSDAAPR